MPLNPSLVNRNLNQPSRLIVALDFDAIQPCLALVDQLSSTYCRVKIGKELFTHAGPAVVDALQKRGFEVFLDLKFHDIPVTVAKALKIAADLGVWMVNVHAAGGPRMLTAAAEAIANCTQKPKLIAVTVLTSMEQPELAATGIATPLQDHVIRLAELSKECGLDGVVCSAQEAAVLRNQFGEAFILVTPGIRPEGFIAHDQRRVMTPDEAIKAGSHYLVVGRAITQAPDPLAVCRDIYRSIEML